MFNPITSLEHLMMSYTISLKIQIIKTTIYNLILIKNTLNTLIETKSTNHKPILIITMKTLKTTRSMVNLKSVRQSILFQTIIVVRPIFNLGQNFPSRIDSKKAVFENSTL